MRWLDGIPDLMDVSLDELRELVMNRGAWHAVICVPGRVSVSGGAWPPPPILPRAPASLARFSPLGPRDTAASRTLVGGLEPLAAVSARVCR